MCNCATLICVLNSVQYSFIKRTEMKFIFIHWNDILVENVTLFNFHHALSFESNNTARIQWWGFYDILELKWTLLSLSVDKYEETRCSICKYSRWRVARYCSIIGTSIGEKTKLLPPIRTTTSEIVLNKTRRTQTVWMTRTIRCRCYCTLTAHCGCTCDTQYTCRYWHNFMCVEPNETQRTGSVTLILRCCAIRF